MASKTKSKSRSEGERGKVYLVGAGPGDLGLVTLRAKECIENADVIVYDHLANPEILGWAREDAEIIYAGKEAGESQLNQQEINALLIEKAREGKQVVRLKGGDPFVFGRGAEEAGGAQRFASSPCSLRHHRPTGNAHRYSFRHCSKSRSQRFQSAGGGGVW